MSVRLKRRINSKIVERKDPGGSFADEPPKFSLRYLQESHSTGNMEMTHLKAVLEDISIAIADRLHSIGGCKLFCA